MQQQYWHPTSIVGMGELVWDIFPDDKRLGGAPCNFIYMAQQLGNQQFKYYMASAVGKDALGEELIQHLQHLGLQHEYIYKDANHTTGVVDVYVDAKGQPEFTIHDNAAWDHIPPLPVSLAESCQVFCFGSQGQRQNKSRHSIMKFLQSMPDTALKIFDVNLRQNCYSKEILLVSLQQADILKTNDEEIKIIGRLLHLQGDDAAILHQLRDNFHLRLAILTRGEQGSVLINENECVTHPGQKITVVDSVGAGDAFTAAIAIGLLQQHSLARINDDANRVAAYVCTQAGATPVLPMELVNIFSD